MQSDLKNRVQQNTFQSRLKIGLPKNAHETPNSTAALLELRKSFTIFHSFSIHDSPKVQHIGIPDSTPKYSSGSDGQLGLYVYGGYEIGGQVFRQYQLSLIRVHD